MNEPAANTVGNFGSGALAPGVFPLRPSSHGNVAVFSTHQFDKLLNVGRVILTIAVQHHKDVSGCKLQPCVESAALSAVLGQSDRSHSFNAAQDIPGPVGTAIIHRDDLGMGLAFDDLFEDKFCAFFFVVERNDNTHCIETRSCGTESLRSLKRRSVARCFHCNRESLFAAVFRPGFQSLTAENGVGPFGIVAEWYREFLQLFH